MKERQAGWKEGGRRREVRKRGTYGCIAFWRGEDIQSHFAISIEIDGRVIRFLPDQDRRPITILEKKKYPELYLERL
jgi:hypothetical protein